MCICLPLLASGANMWKLAWRYGPQPMNEEGVGHRRESIPNRRGVRGVVGERDRGGDEQNVRREQRQRAVCLPADIWVLLADS